MQYKKGKVWFWVVLIVAIIIVIPIIHLAFSGASAVNSIQAVRNNEASVQTFQSTHLLSLDLIIPQGEQKAGESMDLRGKGFLTTSNGSLTISKPDLTISLTNSQNVTSVAWEGTPTSDTDVEFTLPATLSPGSYSVQISINKLNLQSNSMNFTVGNF